MNDLQKLINDFIRKTMKDIQIEAADEFDRNFEREAFFNKAWARRKFNDDTSRGLLVQTGALRRSITSRLEDHSIVLEKRINIDIAPRCNQDIYHLNTYQHQMILLCIRAPTQKNATVSQSKNSGVSVKR